MAFFMVFFRFSSQSRSFNILKFRRISSKLLTTTTTTTLQENKACEGKWSEIISLGCYMKGPKKKKKAPILPPPFSCPVTGEMPFILIKLVNHQPSEEGIPRKLNTSSNNLEGNVDKDDDL
jgi:hypothetical protein